VCVKLAGVLFSGSKGFSHLPWGTHKLRLQNWGHVPRKAPKERRNAGAKASLSDGFLHKKRKGFARGYLG